MAPWFHGKYLVVDLSKDGKPVAKNLDAEAYRILDLGRGHAALVWALTVSEYSNARMPGPLDPGNPLVIAAGSLVGTRLSTASKTTVVARSPLTGLLGRSSVGGRLGWEIRRTGFDSLAIVGSLDEPGVLLVDCDGVRIEPAGDLWGATIEEARAELRKKYPGYYEAVIGPAGENLSAMALIDFNGRQAGRTGLGAVMGSKRLKAILAKGCMNPEPASPEDAARIARALNRDTLTSPASKRLIEYGTPAMAELAGAAHGLMPSRNWARNSLDWCKGDYSKLARWAPELRTGRNPCHFCSRPCSQVITVKGRKVDGPEYETVYSLGTMVGVCSVPEIGYLNLLADELGLDTISLGVTIAWAIEAGEKGLLEGAPRWGDVDAIARLIEDIAYRRGELGSLLADGVRKAAEKIGGISFAIHSKGLELPAYDARGLKGMALGYAVGTRGGDHLTSGAYAVELTGKLWKWEGVDKLDYESKPALVAEMEDLMAYFDNTGICKFSRYTLTPDKVAPLHSAVTGFESTTSMLMKAGAATVTLERLLDNAMGLDRSLDDLPERLKKEPIREGPTRGEVVDPEKLEWMKAEYYKLRGWSIDGVVTRGSLEKLGLTGLLPEGLLKVAV